MSPAIMPLDGRSVNDAERQRWRDLDEIRKNDLRILALVLHESDDEVIKGYVLKAEPQKIDALRDFIDANRCECNRRKAVNDRSCEFYCPYCAEHLDFLCDNPACIEEQFLEKRQDMLYGGEER